ncbi:MAG: sulfurase [Gammaproteobacteria bacterium]|jgi:MOSC domain-containing protein YiiM|nr:sulfurase [Gammaproteobacteria bacterium]MBT3860207.1 sulfurase [Gammaproteobacteria bacterium]MBT3987499.1 sulfurase [Gammaproteobacteria bacterium]MBT4255345.1 sulfurase [Gammaproteobacteria bacterium]MBT4581763.1 sulfurase [Gammaproteobacteria bacterium]
MTGSRENSAGSRENSAGSVEGIYVATNSKDSVQQVQSAELEAGKGIKGDRYHSNSSAALADGKEPKQNQVTLISREELELFLANNNAELGYGDFRRNIVCSGIDLNALVGKEFRLGSALCRGFELCEPCSFLKATVHSAVLPELVHKGGLRAVILEDGMVDTGSKITL